MAIQPLGKLCYSGKLDKCKVNIRYINYTWITRRPIEFVLDFPQSDLDVDVFMDLTLGMWVDGNRR